MSVHLYPITQETYIKQAEDVLGLLKSEQNWLQEAYPSLAQVVEGGRRNRPAVEVLGDLVASRAVSYFLIQDELARSHNPIVGLAAATPEAALTNGNHSTLFSGVSVNYFLRSQHQQNEFLHRRAGEALIAVAQNMQALVPQRDGYYMEPPQEGILTVVNEKNEHPPTGLIEASFMAPMGSPGYVSDSRIGTKDDIFRLGKEKGQLYFRDYFPAPDPHNLTSLTSLH